MVKRSRIRSLLTCTALLWLASPAGARVGTWGTDASVGANEVTITIDLDCAGAGLVCQTLDAYSDVQTGALSGAGLLDVDMAGQAFSFLQDGSADLGGGPVPTHAELAVGDLDFAAIPFVGAPMTRDGITFHASGPPLSVPGLSTVPGDHPFSVAVDAAAIADMIGPVDAYLDEVILPAQSITLTGTLRILNRKSDGTYDYELRDLAGSLSVANPTVLLGENVTVNVDADLTANLSGTVGEPAGVPALGPAGTALLAALLLAWGARASRRMGAA